MRFIMLLAVVMATCALMENASAQTGKRYALLIGIANYEHSGMSKLAYPEADARVLGALLQSGGYEVESLLGPQATQRAILTKLEALNTKGSADGVVLVGLFGHGVEIAERGAEPGKAATEGCFCPYDTLIRVVRDTKNQILYDNAGKALTEPDPKTLVKLSELMTHLSVAKAGNRAVLADCCRNIPNEARGRSFGSSFQAKDLPENTSVLFGCSPRQQAFEHKDWGHGAFTKCLLDELPRLADIGAVTTGTLIDRLKLRVPEIVASVSPNDRQTPKAFFTDTLDLQLKFSSKKLPTNYTSPSTGMKFTLIPAGEFLMGSTDADEGAANDEKPRHRVRISNPFYMGVYEVTQYEFRRVTGRSPWQGKKYVQEGDSHAASYIRSEDADEFCKKLSEREGRTYRLPTEAEWEYACRAGATTRFSFGDNESRFEDYGWYDKNGCDVGEKYAHVSGQKKPNAFGLYDMHGNVWELCQDVYDEKSYGHRGGLTLDPLVTAGGEYRVMRGGSWRSGSIFGGAAYRRSTLFNDTIGTVTNSFLPFGDAFMITLDFGVETSGFRVVLPSR